VLLDLVSAAAVVFTKGFPFDHMFTGGFDATSSNSASVWSAQDDDIVFVLR